MTLDQQNHLLELFAAFEQGTLTEAEYRELQAVLRTDIEARRFWFLHQDLELGLKCLTQAVTRSGEKAGNSEFIGTGSANADVGPDIRLPTSPANLSRVSTATRRNLTVSVATLLCLSAMAMFGLQIWMQQPDADRVVASRIANQRTGNFIVESPTHGTTFALADQKGKVLALHFLLKTECPNCLKLAHDYSQLATSNPDVVHLFLKPDSTDEIKVWAAKISQEGLKNPPVVYRDPDARLANEFNIPDGYQFHGQSVHYPALVLLDSSGKELFRYVGKDNTDRMKPDDFIARLAMVTSPN
ncbi:MAG: redoxin family protein [Schlesneria sp.]